MQTHTHTHTKRCSGATTGLKLGGTIMASAVARAYMGSGAEPQWGPGAKPLVRGSGGRSPSESEAFFTIADVISG